MLLDYDGERSILESFKIDQMLDLNVTSVEGIEEVVPFRSGNTALKKLLGQKDPIVRCHRWVHVTLEELPHTDDDDSP